MPTRSTISACTSGSIATIHSQCRENICRTAPAAHTPVAVFDNRTAGSCSNNGRSGADIEGLRPVPPGTAGVDKHPPGHRFYRDRIIPHHPGKCSYLALQFHPSYAVQGGTHQSGPATLCPPLLFSLLRSFSRGEILPSCKFCESLFEHHYAPGFPYRKFLIIRSPSWDRILSG